MDETKVVVPEGMLNAAMDAAQAHFNGERKNVRIAVEAALRWLDARLAEMCLTNTYPGKLTSHAAMVEVWREGIQDVRRMFLAPEPEVPEALRDLLWLNADQFTVHGRTFDEAVIEAYRRGQQTKP